MDSIHTLSDRLRRGVQRLSEAAKATLTPPPSGGDSEAWAERADAAPQGEDGDAWLFDDQRGSSLLLGGASAAGPSAATSRTRALQGVVFAAQASSLLSALRSASEPSKVAATRAILSASSGVGAHALLLGGAVPLLLQTLGSRLGSAELFVWTAGALAALACCGGGGGAGGSPVEAALEALQGGGGGGGGGGSAVPLPDAMLAALFALTPRVSAQRAIASGGGVAALCVGLALHAADPRACAAGLLALRCATLGMDSRVCEALPLSELVEVLRAALCAHAEGEAAVAMHAAWALRNVMASPGGRACAAPLSRCAAPLVAALRAHGAEAAGLCVLEPCARAVCNMALSPLLQEALIGAGAVGAVAAALEMHAHDPVAAECCSAALANLAAFRDTNLPPEFLHLAPRLCDLVLVPHAGNLQVVKPAVRLARNIAVDERLRGVFFHAEGVPALIEVMRVHARKGAAAAAVTADCRMVLSCAQEYVGGAGGGRRGGYTAPSAPEAVAAPPPPQQQARQPPPPPPPQLLLPPAQLKKVWGPAAPRAAAAVAAAAAAGGAVDGEAGHTSSGEGGGGGIRVGGEEGGGGTADCTERAPLQMSPREKMWLLSAISNRIA